ncbi:hypothetical protein G5714_002869 [Onychostoma macrolepis]|uniref:C-type lectin domain-containing protein n=1 Tax=Onychostoma macrolepis TaxID=369639 RepID=A0A7J6D7Z3_9TELE|nr:hypothetical protein G5714_002869 [Onychostoma macrolepis]
MERKDVVEAITDVNRDARNRHNVRTETENPDTKRHQTPRHTGSVCLKVRSSRAAPVCLMLLCVLLLTAVIVLGVNLHNMIEEFYIKNKNLTDEIEELKNRKHSLDKNITELSATNKHLIEQKPDLQKKIDELWNQISKMDGWDCYQSSLYYVTSEKKSWTESRRDCTERGADLIIINNRQEQDFVKKISANAHVWIGLTDIDVEGTWKWVDGSTLTSGFWDPREPNGHRGENCALIYSPGWADYPCSDRFLWICEKSILK